MEINKKLFLFKLLLRISSAVQLRLKFDIQISLPEEKLDLVYLVSCILICRRDMLDHQLQVYQSSEVADTAKDTMTELSPESDQVS